MELIIRPYQAESIDDLTTAVAHGARRVLLVAPTGSGKTVIFSRIIQHATSNGKKVLFLAHRREIVNQTTDKLDQLGVPSGIIMSGDEWDHTQPVTVASIQTLHSWMIRRKRMSPPKADVVFIDEAHHYNSSKTWQDILALYPEAYILGATATPINRRGRGLGHFFDAMVKCPTIEELTEQKYLVPVRYFVPSLPDLAGIKVTAGDYNEKQLENRMDKPKIIGDICENWARQKDCVNRKTLIFATGIKHSIHIVEEFTKIGVKAAHVDGHTDKSERDRIVKEFSEGDIQVLSNCAVFTEGTDIPAASCLIFARPTKSLLLYLQVAGRGLRPYPGKENLIMLDHAGVVKEHGAVAQDWEWKLDYGEGDVKKETAKQGKLKKEIHCGNCKCVYYGRLACPECLWKPTIKGKYVETLEAYLIALDEMENPPPADKKDWWLGLVWYATHTFKSPKMSRDNLPSWAYAKFQEKFGSWPHSSYKKLEPVEPNKEILAWIRKGQKTYYWKKNNPELAARIDARTTVPELMSQSQEFI